MIASLWFQVAGFKKQQPLFDPGTRNLEPETISAGLPHHRLSVLVNAREPKKFAMVFLRLRLEPQILSFELLRAPTRSSNRHSGSGLRWMHCRRCWPACSARREETYRSG